MDVTSEPSCIKIAIRYRYKCETYSFPMYSLSIETGEVLPLGECVDARASEYSILVWSHVGCCIASFHLSSPVKWREL